MDDSNSRWSRRKAIRWCSGLVVGTVALSGAASARPSCENHENRIRERAAEVGRAAATAETLDDWRDVNRLAGIALNQTRPYLSGDCGDEQDAIALLSAGFFEGLREADLTIEQE
jgi:hypothetical protein